VPRFFKKAECVAWMEKWCRVGSNMEERTYQHIFSMLTSWDQV
jgi:hypothetical protein